LNYAKHLQEALADKGIHHGNLVSEIHKAGMFLKAASAVVGTGEGVKLVHTERRNDTRSSSRRHPAARRKNVSAAARSTASPATASGLDMTIRGPEERSLRKSPDSYCVLGPWLVTPDEVGDPAACRCRSRSTASRARMPARATSSSAWRQLIAWGSTFYTLHPGDVILTGTPQGVGPVSRAIRCSARIDRIGAMQVKVS
jgi:2-keto-4-pentenoate hydratase/2-oxohepta-3-ene-1,7-dioic acid hydratase in catechol pathway